MTNAVIILSLCLVTNAAKHVSYDALVVAPEHGRYQVKRVIPGIPPVPGSSNSMPVIISSCQLHTGTNTVSIPSMAVYHPDQFRQTLQIVPVKEAKK